MEFQRVAEPVETLKVRKAFDRPGFPVIEVAAVCDVNADSVKCWDFDGKLLEDLALQITRRALATGDLVPFQPARKNRWIALERPPDSSRQGWRISKVLSTLPPPSLLSGVGRYSWAGLASSQDALEGEVTVRFSSASEVQTLPLKEGSTVRIKGQMFRLVGFGPAGEVPKEIDASAPFPVISHMSLETVGGEAINSQPEYPYFIDKAGLPVESVDARGFPFRLPPGMGGKVNFARTSAHTKPKTNRITYLSNVDLQQVSSLKFAWEEVLNVEFTGIPLDPKP